MNNTTTRVEVFHMYTLSESIGIISHIGLLRIT